MESTKKVKTSNKNDKKPSVKKVSETPVKKVKEEPKELIKNLSEPWFSLIKLKLKKVEGRLNKDDFIEINKNDIIIFQNNDFGFRRSFNVKISSVHEYNSFNELLINESIDKVLPGIDTIEHGIEIYRKYYSKQEEDRYKVKAIRMLVLK